MPCVGLIAGEGGTGCMMGGKQFMGALVAGLGE